MLIKTRKQRLSKHFFLYANCSLFKKRTPCTILFFLNYETISNSHLRGIITLTVNFIRSTFKTNCFFPKISVFLPSRSIPLTFPYTCFAEVRSLSLSFPHSSFYHRVCLPSSRSEAFTNGSLPSRFYLLYGRRWVKTSCYGKMFLLIESIQDIM